MALIMLVVDTDTIAINFILKRAIEAVVEDVIDSIFENIDKRAKVAVEVTVILRVFPMYDSFDTAEVDNIVNVLGKDFTMVDTEIDNKLIVLEIDRPIDTVETTVKLNPIK